MKPATNGVMDGLISINNDHHHSRLVDGPGCTPGPATVVILTGGHYEQLGDIFEGGDSFYPHHCSALL